MSKLLFSIALAGLIVSGYLFATSVSAIPLVCGEDSGCHTVQGSQYAKHFGIPTAAYGVVYYAFLAVAASVWNQSRKGYLFAGLVLLTASGLAVSAWLTYLEAFVILAWCYWCVISAILATLAFLVVWLHPTKQWQFQQTQKSESA